MPLYEFTRRLTQAPLARHSLWWNSVVNAASGTEMLGYVEHILKPNHGWVCSDDTAFKALDFFKQQPGWEGADGGGHPVAFRRLSPREEHEALTQANPELRTALAPECICPPNAPRRVRREAERAWNKWLDKKLRQLEVAE